MALSASASTVIQGQPVTLTATIGTALQRNGAANVGSVTFMDGKISLGSVTLSAGQATLTTSALPAGVQVLTASYSGGGNFAASSSQIGPSSIITTVAGDGTLGSAGAHGPATAAELESPVCIAFDSAANLFIADFNNNRICEVNCVTGAVTTVAGDGTAGYSGDNGPATAAELSYPTGIALDSAGDLFIADTGDGRIRKVNLTTGVITTVAGDGTSGYGGDNGAATAAELNTPTGVALDSAGDLFIADVYNNVVREVNHATGLITTVAGNATAGYNGDNGQATAAELYYPIAVAVDSVGDLFIADAYNNAVREVNRATGVITTVAGNGFDAGTGTGGYSGDNGQATAAELNEPTGVAVDSTGDLFIADFVNNRVREVNLATGVITTAAGNGSGVSGDTVNLAAGTINTTIGDRSAGYAGNNGPATAAELSLPSGVAVDSAGDLFVADPFSGRVLEIAGGTTVTVITPATSPVYPPIYQSPTPVLPPSPALPSTPAPPPMPSTATAKAAVLKPGASGGLPNPGERAEGDPSGQFPGLGMLNSRRYEDGAGGGNLQETMLLALNDLTISTTNVFDAGDLPAEPAPPQKVDAPDVLPEPPGQEQQPPVVIGRHQASREPVVPLFSAERPWLLSAAALLSALAGYAWHRFHVRRQRQLLDAPLFQPARMENPPDGDEIRRSPPRRSMEEIEHGYRQ
jgi:hypothetical protein